MWGGDPVKTRLMMVGVRGWGELQDEKMPVIVTD